MRDRFTTTPEEAKALKQMEGMPFRKTPWGFRCMICMAEALFCCHIVHLSINGYQVPENTDIFSGGLGGLALQLNLFIIIPSLLCSALPKGIYVARFLLPLLALLNLAAAVSQGVTWSGDLHLAYLAVPPFLFIAADNALRAWQSWCYGHCFYVVTFVDLARKAQKKEPHAARSFNRQFAMLMIIVVATLGWFMSL